MGIFNLQKVYFADNLVPKERLKYEKIREQQQIFFSRFEVELSSIVESINTGYLGWILIIHQLLALLSGIS
jgi:hypothetical protein